MRVIVIGAGLGGLTLANGLRRAGIDVGLYERDAARGRPQGVSLHIDDRGIAALRACLSVEHAAMAEATMGGLRGRTLLLSEVAGELAITGSRPFDDAPGATRPGRQADRPLLRSVLLSGLAGAVRFGARFTRYEVRPDRRVRVWFADGTVDTADVLVGADGIGSAVRRQRLPHARVVDTGKRMLMGATPLRAVAGTGLSAMVGDDPAAAHVGDTMMALGVLRHRVPPVVARDRWLPALRCTAVSAAEDYVMWALPHTGDVLGPPAVVWRRAADLAEGLPPALRLVVTEAWAKQTAALRTGTMVPIPPWRPGRVTIIGDALHPAPGFGGNVAMRDAQRLRDELVLADRGEQDAETAIGVVEERLRREDHAPVAGREAG